MMEIRILRNCKLINGEQYYDKEEIIKCDNFSFSIIRHFYKPDKYENKIYIQINNFLDPDFKEYEISSKDFVYIKEK